MYKTKIAVITGAASGIGRALALEMAKKNCNLILVDIFEKGLDKTIKIIENQDIFVEKHIVDLSEKEQIHTFSAKIIEKYSQIDFLFNIAGIAAGGTFEEMKEETFERLIGVNLMSQVYLMKDFIPRMKKEETTYIVNMSSLNGKAAFAEQSAYSASKFAVRGVSNAIAYEISDSNIQMSVLYPGAVRTNIVRNAIPASARDISAKHTTIAKGMDATRAARIILKGIKKGKRDIVVGRDAHLVLFLKHFFPIRYWDMIKRNIHL